MGQAIEINIAIVPSQEVSERARSLSRGLTASGGLFELGIKKNIPHISLYHFAVKTRRMVELYQTLDESVGDTRQFGLRQKGYRNYDGGWIDMEYVKCREILELQDLVITRCNELREGYVRPDELVGYDVAPLARRANIDKYGFGSVGECYHPHLTLTKTKSYDPSMLERLERVDLSFNVEGVAVFELGEWGTCKRLLKTYNLR